MSRYIIKAMYLEKTKTSYNLEWREYRASYIDVSTDIHWYKIDIHWYKNDFGRNSHPFLGAYIKRCRLS
jgi:hypothetical protein